MSTADAGLQRRRALPRLWPLLLPAAYLAHLAEEAWGGVGFVAWMRAGPAPSFTAQRFFLLNAVFWSVVLAIALITVARPSLRFPALAITAVLAMNGVIHLLSSLATLGYAPGTGTGALLYLPLGIWILGRSAPTLPPGRMPAIWAAAVALHLVVFLLARYGVPGVG